MADRDDKFYFDIAADGRGDLSDDDFAKLVEVLKKIDSGEYDDGDAEDDYETMDPVDFIRKALGEDFGGGDDEDDEEDDNPWRFNVDEEYDTAWDDSHDDGGEGIDSVGDDDDESEDKEEPDLNTVSDEKKKDKNGKKGKSEKKEDGCTVSDRRTKRPKSEAPSEEELTQRTVASVLGDLRF